MYLNWIKAILIALSVQSVLSQTQQCMQLQSCMELASKTSTELQQFPSSSSSAGSYSGISVHTGSAQCRSLRTNFECMINYTPFCLRVDFTRNSPLYISQAKQLLDAHCDQGTGWSNTQCYRKPEITQNCETMLPELSIGSYNYYSASIPKYVCEKYRRFRHCVYNVVLNQCNPLERETFFSYLYDKVQEVSWKCANDSIFYDNYERYHPLASSASMYNGIATNVGQPPYIYGSSNYGVGLSSGYAGTNLYQTSGQFNNRYPGSFSGYPNNYYDRSRYGDVQYGGNRYGGYGSMPYSGGYGTGYAGYQTYDDSNCIEKTRFEAKQCEMTFMQKQKDARNERTSVDIQRQLCCAIYKYRDCLAITVQKYCRDNNMAVVDYLMGEGRKRELQVSCREYGYEYCNSSKQIQTHVNSVWRAARSERKKQSIDNEALME